MKPEETLYFLQSAQVLARYHNALGIDHYPAGATLSNLGRMSRPRQTMPTAVPPAGPRHQPVPQADATPVIAALPELSGCRRCGEGSIQPLSAMAGRIGRTPKLLVVGDYFHGDNVGGEFVFGREEDELLAKMLTAIALTDDDVFITNLVKCLPALRDGAEHGPGEAVAERCLAHLRRQILLTRPRLILTMGDLPARILVGKKVSLSALRGRLHNFFPQDGQADSSPTGQPDGPPENQPVPILVSYHPTFLLAQAEMKKAAWEDLKMVRRFLASQPPPVRAAGR
jgi:DNA polymerase